jgi:hypothetical protein
MPAVHVATEACNRFRSQRRLSVQQQTFGRPAVRRRQKQTLPGGRRRKKA